MHERGESDSRVGDRNENGVLDADEVTDSQIVCNGAGGDGGNGCNGSSLAGGGPQSMSTFAELLVIMLMPFVLAIGRRMRRDRRQDS